MADRSIRSLEFLETSASTSRVLNLRALQRRKTQDPDYLARPLFQNPALNSSIIIKHRLRPDEYDQFPNGRRTATKILFPIETDELRLGARYVFIGQRRFEQTLFQGVGVSIAEGGRDLRTLAVLDETPTLDPFLLREQLRRRDLEPALCYFELSSADTKRMFDFAQREIEPLARMSTGRSDLAPAQTAKLTRKILANAADSELEPLRRTLQLDYHQFQDGVFCWKAFLYYKWQLADLLPQVAPVLKQIASIRPRGPQDDEIKVYLRSARETLHRAIIASCRAVKATIEVYDAAYDGLTARGDPTAFREFLLQAPDLFNELGERLGAIQHMISFWRFRFPGDRLPVITADELSDLFMDFENSLGFEPETPDAALQAASALTVSI
jgi:hypothetical protein